MEYLLEFHPAHTLLLTLVIGFIVGMIFVVWWDDQYQKEQQERKEQEDARVENERNN